MLGNEKGKRRKKRVEAIGAERCKVGEYCRKLKEMKREKEEGGRGGSV